MDVKTVSIKQLHETTGHCVRDAATEPLYVTDHGRPVAVLRAIGADAPLPRPFPRRQVTDLPAVGIDSTAGISAERDGR